MKFVELLNKTNWNDIEECLLNKLLFLFSYYTVF